MIKSSIEKMANDIGFDIGNSDDTVQSDLLNGLCRGMDNSMGEREIEMQVCYIVDKLTTQSCTVIKRFASFIELKDTEK